MRTINKTEQILKHNSQPLAVWEIYKSFSVPVEILHYDYTIIGLRAEQPLREAGGIKSENDYTTIIEGERRNSVKKFFNYVYTDPDPSKVGVWLEHVFLNMDGTTEGASKIEFKPLSIGEVAAVRRKQREFAISRLDSIGLIMPELTGDLETLRVHYSEEISFFEKYGNNDFQNGILTEAAPQIVTILNKLIIYGGETFSVKDAILQQTNPHYIT